MNSSSHPFQFPSPVTPFLFIPGLRSARDVQFFCAKVRTFRTEQSQLRLSGPLERRSLLSWRWNTGLSIEPDSGEGQNQSWVTRAFYIHLNSRQRQVSFVPSANKPNRLSKLLPSHLISTAVSIQAKNITSVLRAFVLSWVLEGFF